MTKQRLILMALAAVAVVFGVACVERFFDLVTGTNDYMGEYAYTVRCEKGVFQAYKVTGGPIDYDTQAISSPINGKSCRSISKNDTERGYTYEQAIQLGIIPPGTMGSETGRRVSGSTVAPYDSYRTLLPLPFAPLLTASDAAALQPKSCDPNGAVFFVGHDTGEIYHLKTCPLSLANSINVGSNPLQMALTPDARQLVVTRYDNAVVVIDTSTDQIVKTIPTPELYPSGVAVTPDGTQAWITNYIEINPQVFLLDLASGHVVKSIPTQNFPRSVALTPDGTQAWVNYYSSTSIDIFDTMSGDAIGVVNPFGTSNEIRFNPTGTRAYVAANPDQLAIYDTATLNRLASVTVVNRPLNVNVSLDGRVVLVSGAAQSGITVVHARTFQILTTLRTNDSAQGMAFYR